MKKAVIQIGSKQYLVSEGDTVETDLIKMADKNVDFVPLLIIDDKGTKIGNPGIKDASVTAAVLEQDKIGDKVTSIRYKAKKRVKKVRGHRQHFTVLKVQKITQKQAVEKK